MFCIMGKPSNQFNRYADISKATKVQSSYVSAERPLRGKKHTRAADDELR